MPTPLLDKVINNPWKLKIFWKSILVIVGVLFWWEVIHRDPGDVSFNPVSEHLSDYSFSDQLMVIISKNYLLLLWMYFEINHIYILNLFKYQHKKCLLIHDLVETCQSWDGQPEQVVDATDQVSSEDGNRDEQHVHVELLQSFYPSK